MSDYIPRVNHDSTDTIQASGQPIDNKANNAKLRRWMLVINNPTFKESEQIYELAHDKHVAGLMWSAEHAHDAKENENANLTEHYHIYVSLVNPQRMSWFKQRFPRAHIEAAHKPALACCRYVAKEGFYMAFGNVPDLAENPSRSVKKKAEDLAREEVVKKIRNGEMRFQDLSDAQLLDSKLVRAAEKAASMTQGPMRHGVKVCVFVSPSGWGKSYNVWETFQRVAGVEFANNQQWFLDAEQEVMLFDEFAGLQSQCRAQRMLKYLDENPISLPVKGGHRPCYWKLIFILSNTPPNEWYMTKDASGNLISSIPEHTRDALYRRIGYANWEGVDPNRQTHVYMEPFSNLNAARDEIKKICVKLHSELYPEGVPSPINQDDPDQVQKDQEEEREAIRQLAEIHGIDIDQEERRWDRAREIQREREEHEYDDMPGLEPGTPPSEQDPLATVPTLQEIEHEELSDMDTCPDPPSDESDMEDISDDNTHN